MTTEYDNKALWIFKNFKESIDEIPKKYRGRAWEILINHAFGEQEDLEKENKYIKMVVKSLLPLIKLRGKGGSTKGISNNPSGKIKPTIAPTIAPSIAPTTDANVGATPYITETLTITETEKETITETLTEKNEDEVFSDLNSSFDEWFKNYPKQLGKLNAFEEYKKAIESGATKEELLEGVIRYAAYVKDECTDIQYIKYPDNWLKQSCWQDVYISSKQLAEQKQKEYEEEQRRLEEERKIIHLEEEKERQEQERLRKLEEEKKIAEGRKFMDDFITSGKSEEFKENLRRKSAQWKSKSL